MRHARVDEPFGMALDNRKTFVEGTDGSRARSLQKAEMEGRYIERFQIALFGSLLHFTWWCRRAATNLERRLLRAGVWLTDSQKPRSRH